MKPEILAYNDYVLIEGKRMERKTEIRASDWISFWKNVEELNSVSLEILLENARREGYLQACLDHGVVILPQPEPEYEQPPSADSLA